MNALTSPLHSPPFNFIIERYMATDEEIKENIKTIQIFISTISKASFADKTRLEEACFRAKLVFYQIQTLAQLVASPLSPLILKLINLVSITSIAQSFDEFNQARYLDIIQSIAKSSFFDQGLSPIALYFSAARLIHPPSSVEKNISETLARFAIGYFDYLSLKTQKILIQTYRLTQLEDFSSDNLEDQADSIFSQKIKAIFSAFHPILEPVKSIPIREEGSTRLKWTEAPGTRLVPPPSHAVKGKKKESLEEFQCISNYRASEEESVLKNKKIEEDKRIEEQLKRMQGIFKAIIQVYLPIALHSLSTPLASSLDTILIKFSKEFDESFPRVASRFLFQNDKIFSISKFEQSLICSSLNQFALFLQDLNQDLSTTKRLTSSNLQDETYTLCHEIFAILLKNNQSPDELPSCLDPLFASFGALISTYFFNQIPTSYHICLLIERLLDTTLDTKEADEVKPSLNSFPVQSTISQELGESVYKIGKELFSIVESKGVMNLVVKACLKALELKKNLIGEKIQQVVSQIKTSSSNLFPLLLIHHFLFRQDGANQLIPTFAHPFIADLKEINELKTRLKQKILDKYPLLLEMVKQQSSIGGLCFKADAVKEFYGRLIERIWAIVHNDGYLKLLNIYLLTGLKQTLSKKA